MPSAHRVCIRPFNNCSSNPGDTLTSGQSVATSSHSFFSEACLRHRMPIWRSVIRRVKNALDGFIEHGVELSVGLLGG